MRAYERAYTYHAADERVALVPVTATPSGYRLVEISEAGLRFEVPADCQQLAPEKVWTPAGDGALRLGLNWMALEAPLQPEAALLPDRAQILTSEPMALDWGDGRSFTLEVYGPVIEGDKAPVESIQTHVLVVISSDDGRQGFGFYASAPTAEQLAQIEPVLTHALETAVLDGLEEVGESRTASWQVLRDEVYGFQLAHPEDWTYKDLNTRGAGVADDWPVERMAIFFPQAWAEQFEPSGAPDPNAPPSFPALNLEVCVGPEEQFRRAYVEPNASETLTINGVEAVREESGGGEYVTITYVFQNPANPDVRVVLVDNLSTFTERAAQHPDIVDLIPVVVATFEFVR